ncbi:MAG: GNAT family N-acetyltransferase [Candidatus Lokiarchaeota archaeon]|nr:GNAT family N-acetyltransferase [Candidatus Lokiarchaeota archaeon]
MFKYTIREPKDKEISKSINVLYSAFGRAPPVDIKEEEKIWKALINCEIGKFLISEEKGKVFGIGGVFTFEKVSSFGYMAVLLEYRGKGVGTEIFRNLLEIANKMNSETMILYASQLGEPIYKKFGFKRRFYGMMYQLPIQPPKLGITDKEIKILYTVPDSMLALDKKAMGFDRTNYLNMRIKLGAKILTIEDEGYGLLANKRLGPLVAINLKAALQIINKSITLGADHMIIAKHQYLPKRIFEMFNLTELENRASVKMVYGKEIKKELDLLYAIGTFAKG